MEVYSSRPASYSFDEGHSFNGVEANASDGIIELDGSDNTLTSKPKRFRNKNKDLVLRVIAGLFAALIVFPYVIPKFRKWVVLGPKEKYNNIDLNKVSTFPIERLPLEIARFIFAECKTDLANLALVSKRWQAVADDKELYKMIFPYDVAFTPEDWRDNLGLKVNAATRLPRRVHRDIEKGEHLLTWIPESYTHLTDRYNRSMSLNAAFLGSFLTTTPKQGHPAKFDHIDRKGLKKLRSQKETPRKSRWVWIDRDIKWFNTSFHQQKILARKQKPRISISKLEDTVISLLLKYNKSGERCVIWEPSMSESGRNLAWMRVKCENGDAAICSFTEDGLLIRPHKGERRECVGVAIGGYSPGF